MTTSLPLFEAQELKDVKAAREELLNKLRKGGIEAHSRIRMERKAALLTVQQLKIEQELARR